MIFKKTKSAPLKRTAILLIATAALFSVPARAVDQALLRNGFALRHHHRENIGGITRLYLTTGNTSFVDVPTADIASYEAAPAETTSAPSVGVASDLQAPKASLAPAAGRQSAPGSPRNAISQPDLQRIVAEAASRHAIDPDLIHSVIRAESAANPRARSPKGARGLMQLMPGTAAALGVSDAYDPAANVEGGTRYLRELLALHDNDMVKALAAYNAGDARVQRYHGVPPYRETRAYVARIVKDFNRKKIADRRRAASSASAASPSKPSTTTSASAPAPAGD